MKVDTLSCNTGICTFANIVCEQWWKRPKIHTHTHTQQRQFSSRKLPGSYGSNFRGKGLGITRQFDMCFHHSHPLELAHCENMKNIRQSYELDFPTWVAMFYVAASPNKSKKLGLQNPGQNG